MGKKSKVNFATDNNKAKNPDPTPEAPPTNGSDHHVAEPVVPKNLLKQKTGVRRSGRLQSVIKHVQNQVVEQIDLLESEKEDEIHVENENENENHVEQPSLVSEPCNEDSGNGPTSNPMIRDAMVVDHLVKAVKEYKSKEALELFPSESASVGLIYKSLYLDSQKKIEALTSENHDLARKLEIVLGKLEVYENINKSAQAVVVSNLEKAIEALVRPTSYFGGHVSSNMDDAAAGGGGGDGVVVAKEESAKKRRHDHVI